MSENVFDYMCACLFIRTGNFNKCKRKAECQRLFIYVRFASRRCALPDLLLVCVKLETLSLCLRLRLCVATEASKEGSRRKYVGRRMCHIETKVCLFVSYKWMAGSLVAILLFRHKTCIT